MFSQWRIRAAFFAVLALSHTGCPTSELVQLGSAYAIAPETGLIAFTRDPAMSSSGAVTGSEQKLLCVLIVCPSVRPIGSGSSLHYKGATTRHDYEWTTTEGKISAAFSWDRQSDRVEIWGVHFRRADGNAFVMRRDPNGQWSTQQLASIDTPKEPADALRQIQAQLPDDVLITSLSIHSDAGSPILPLKR